MLTDIAEHPDAPDHNAPGDVLIEPSPESESTETGADINRALSSLALVEYAVTDSARYVFAERRY